ncbi:unnamed protein product [Symbiodinium sp. CCMP2592]|nr:unnamed protein product [Symbiodinium sp. CCMP2592]
MRRRRGLAVIAAILALGAGSAWLTWQESTPGPSEGGKQLSGRRQALSTATVGAASLTEAAEAAEVETEQPLTYCGGGFCTSFSLGGRQFRGVVDTGSPFLLVSTCDDGRGAPGRSCSSYCSAWGCTTAAKGRPSGLEDTDEVFAAGMARVSWRKDSLELGGRPFGSITYGVMLEVESYGGNGGGAFLGLVRDRQARIRPTLMGQTDVRTLSIDLRPGEERLSFSRAAPPLQGEGAVVPLVDLRGSGAAVRYYAAEIAAFNVGGKPLEVDGPLVAVLDTGTTGLGLPSALFARYDAQRRERAEELGLKAGQAVEILLKAADGGVLPLNLRQGRQASYESDRFDIVTAIPEPPGIAPDALALWTGDPVGAKRLTLREGEVVAEAEVRTSQRGWVQADRPVSQGDRFLVRLVGRMAGRRAMDAAVGLAPRGSRLTAEEAVAFPGELQSGDLVECLLSDDGSGRVLWRINGGKAVYSEPFETARNVYPTVELGPGAGSVELLSAPAGNAFDEGLGRWARPPSEARSRPTVLFLGLGFLLGRKLSIDTVANRSVAALEPNEFGLTKNVVSGSIAPHVLRGGLHILGPLRSFIVFPAAQGTLEFSMVSPDRQPVKTRTGADPQDPDSGGQPISISCAVQVQFVEETLQQVYLSFGSFEAARQRQLLLAGNVVSNTAQEYTPTDFWTKRDDIAARMLEKINGTLWRQAYVKAMQFEIMKVDFAKQFEDSITAVQVAEQAKVVNEYEQQVQRVVQHISVMKSENEAAIANISAGAEAKSKEIRAAARRDAFNLKQGMKAQKYSELQKKLELNGVQMSEYFKIKSVQGQSSSGKVVVGLPTVGQRSLEAGPKHPDL